MTEDFALLAVILLVYLGTLLSQIELPGVYRDELGELVQTVALLSGQPFLWIRWYTTVAGYRVLLSLTERLGPFRS